MYCCMYCRQSLLPYSQFVITFKLKLIKLGPELRDESAALFPGYCDLFNPCTAMKAPTLNYYKHQCYYSEKKFNE